MEIRIRETGEVMLEGAFRALHQNVSFPAVLTPDVLDEFGADAVLEGVKPSATPHQIVYRDGVEEIDGNWFTKFAVSDMTDEQAAAADENEWRAVRIKRNAKLAASDWTQLADAPLTSAEKAEWATRRQAWRDITNQADPFNLVWPDE